MTKIKGRLTIKELTKLVEQDEIETVPGYDFAN